MSIADKVDWEKGDGMVPAIVQDVITGRVLMLGYMNRPALVETEKSGRVTFFSRTRQTLWTKGETSGNHLTLYRMELDCDHDTILVFAKPVGPTCHLDTKSCFDDEQESLGFGFLGDLTETLRSRIRHKPAGSYTTELLSSQPTRIAQKVGEEAVEVALASTGSDRQSLISESADLLFHLILLLESRDISLADVTQELFRRSNPG